jgi:hypothetical protein
MDCLTSRRALCGLDDAPSAALSAAALAHARVCPRCRRLGLRFADAIMAAAGDELPCAECQAHVDLVALGGAPALAWARREPDLAARVQAHLDGCPDCGAELTLLRSMLAVVGAAAADLAPAAFDTRFADQAPAARRRRERSRPVPPIPAWLRGILERARELTGDWLGGPRASRAALAALTAVVVFALARLVLQDPGLRSALDRVMPAVPPVATADLDSLRAQATAAAAGRATQTAATARPGGAAAPATALPGAGIPGSPMPAGTGTPALQPAIDDEEEREPRETGAAPPATSAPETPEPAGGDDPYPPLPDTPDPYPGGDPGDDPGDDPAYPPPRRGGPAEPVDPTPLP